jgi:hypothetical protein
MLGVICRAHVGHLLCPLHSPARVLGSRGLDLIYCISGSEVTLLMVGFMDLLHLKESCCYCSFH